MKKTFVLTIDVPDDPENIVTAFWIADQLAADYDSFDDYRYQQVDINVKDGGWDE